MKRILLTLAFIACATSGSVQARYRDYDCNGCFTHRIGRAVGGVFNIITGAFILRGLADAGNCCEQDTCGYNYDCGAYRGDYSRC